MNIASKIVPSPIVEAIMEVRFDSHFDAEAIYGLLLNQLKGEYSKTLDLPILEFPATVRKNDPKLKYLPYYRLESKLDKKKLIQIGPKVFSVIITGEYPGWQTFNSEIQYGLEKLEKSDVLSSALRVSLKYVNFFDLEMDILSKTTLGITIEEKKLEADNMLMRFEIKDDEIINILTIGSHAEIAANSIVKKGGVIDIDSVMMGPITDFFQAKDALLEKCHNSQKRLFFSLLSDKYASLLKEIK